MLYQVPGRGLVLHVQVAMCPIIAAAGCVFELMASLALNIGNLRDWFIESIDWGPPIFAQLVYHLVSKLAPIIFLSITHGALHQH